jgi:hypothetical protein
MLWVLTRRSVMGIIGLSEPSHPTSDHAFVVKMLKNINLLKILTGSNICVGTYKTDT